MGQEILVNEQIEPGLELVRLVSRQMPIKVAFWMKEADRDRPYLFIASDTVTDYTWRDAAMAIYDLVDQVGGYGIDFSSVNVIAGDDPSVADAIALRIEDPKRRTRAIGAHRLGNRYGDDVYIYPPVSPEPAVTG